MCGHQTGPVFDSFDFFIQDMFSNLISSKLILTIIEVLTAIIHVKWNIQAVNTPQETSCTATETNEVLQTFINEVQIYKSLKDT
jgi:hypothetical protein